MNLVSTIAPASLQCLWGAALGLCLLISSPLEAMASEPITPEALATQLTASQAPLVLDVRSPEEYTAGHIPGAVNFPYRELPARLTELGAYRTQPIVVYCEIGVRAGIAELTLEQAGFTAIYHL
jgi:rhodanese-related sulfurtransferase